MVKAEFETRNFSFEAFGATEEEARQALEAGWRKHAEQTDADPDYVRRYPEDIVYLTFEMGQCFRDKRNLKIDRVSK